VTKKVAISHIGHKFHADEILVEQALLIQGPREHEQIQAAVYGIIFLGIDVFLDLSRPQGRLEDIQTDTLLATPHNGSSLANIGKIVANIASACSWMNPAKRLLGTLQKDSKALFEITQEFVYKTPKLHLVSFYEMEMTNLVLFRRMVSIQPKLGL